MQKSIIALTVLALSLIACSKQETNESAFSDEIMSKANRIAHENIIIDTHIDLPTRLHENYEDVSVASAGGDFTVPDAKAGGLDALFMSIYIPAEMEAEGTSKAFADELIDANEKLAKDFPQHYAVAYSVADVKKNFEAGKISLPMGMENGAPIEGDLKNLKHFYDRGIRYITLTHALSNHISDSSYDEHRQWNGLSDFGKTVVKEMNKLGVMVDISHVSDEAFYDALEISEVPLIATHSSARHFTPGWERNMNDEMIKALAAKGGVIQINYGSAFLTKDANEYSGKRKEARAVFMDEHGIEDMHDEKVKAFMENYKKENPYPRATLNDVLDHFDHAVKLAGIDHVGIGSDYEGVGDSLPTGLMTVASYPNLIAGLLSRGYSEEDVKKVISGNTLRVWSQAEAYAAQQKDK